MVSLWESNLHLMFRLLKIFPFSKIQSEEEKKKVNFLSKKVVKLLITDAPGFLVAGYYLLITELSLFPGNRSGNIFFIQHLTLHQINII
jgi:hypothetical protein